jgi:hypothetical protein
MSVAPTGSAQARGRGARLKRAALLAAAAVVGLNVWTGSPLLALWIGSRIEKTDSSSGPSMAPIFVVIATMAVASWVLLRLLYRLQDAYMKAAGQPVNRYRSTWLRGLTAERRDWERQHNPALKPTPFEIAVMLCVVAAVAAFEIWFFFFSTSPIDQRSGR